MIERKADRGKRRGNSPIMQDRSLWFDEGKGSEEQQLRDKQTG